MEGSDYKTKYEILKRAQEAIGIPIGEIDKTGRIKTGKGAIGTVIEESWFGYHPNSEAEPDFPEAGVELKATPYIRNSKGISAKERLVCNIINYMTEYDKTFKTSDFWHKCQTILLMSYEHKKDIPKADFTIDKAVLFGFPEADLLIIERDWETIINKIKAGEAHLLTEGDTNYLAACTKGADSSSVRQQPFSDIPAKQRAYSLKSSYMSNILRTYIFGDKRDPNIITDVSFLIEDKDLPGNFVINVDMFSDSSNELLIKDWEQLTDKSLEEVVTDMLSPYYGMSVSALMNMFEIEKTAKRDFLISSCKSDNTLKHEMALEAAMCEILTKEDRYPFGKWDYISHQVAASPFKPVDYMDMMDIFGYRYIPNYKIKSKYLIAELKKDAASIDIVEQIMKYVDWVANEYANKDYSMIEAYLVAADFSSEVIDLVKKNCIRNYTKGVRPAEFRIWNNLKLVRYRVQEDDIEFVVVE